MKTISLKKVSAVAVASLGFGLLSVVPAQAAQTAEAGTLTALNAKSATANTLTVNAAQTYAIGATTDDLDKLDDTETIKISAALTSYPAGGYVGVSALDTATLTHTTAGDGYVDTASGNTVTLTIDGAGTGAASTVTATGTDGIAEFSFTPTVAGTYIVTTWNDEDTDGVIDVAEARVDLTLVIAGLSDFSAGRTTVYIADGAAAATSATTLLGAQGPSTSGTQAANLRVTLNRADDSDYTSGTVYAYMTGPGLLDMTADHTDLNGDDATDVRSDSLASDTDFNIAVTGDGTTGVGTVNLYVLLADGVTKVTLTSRTVTFYGSTSTLSVVQNMSVAKSGGSSIGYTGTAPGAADTVAVVITAKDSTGNIVCADTGISALSSDTSVIASVTVTEDDGTGDGSVGLCNYIAQITSGANSTSGQTATLTFRRLKSGSSTEYITAAPLTFTVGNGTPKTVDLKLDKSTYAPGEKATLTVTMKDSSGNPVSDGAHAAAIDSWVASGSVQGLPTATGPSTTKGVKTYTVYAPVSGGKFSINAVLGTGVAAGATTSSAEATVTDGNAGLLTQIDALNAKIVALNALIAKIMKKLGVK